MHQTQVLQAAVLGSTGTGCSRNESSHANNALTPLQIEDDSDCPRHSNYKVFSSQDLAHTCQKLERRDAAPGFLSYTGTQLEAEF